MTDRRAWSEKCNQNRTYAEFGRKTRSRVSVGVNFGHTTSESNELQALI